MTKAKPLWMEVESEDDPRLTERDRLMLRLEALESWSLSQYRTCDVILKALSHCVDMSRLEIDPKGAVADMDANNFKLVVDCLRRASGNSK